MHGNNNNHKVIISLSEILNHWLLHALGVESGGECLQGLPNTMLLFDVSVSELHPQPEQTAPSH